jgi:asparagine synthase (glutamine-hydrolysing)
MCGFAGFLGGYAAGDTFLEAMGDALYHRGPDDGGVWSDPDAEVGLAFRRLSIIDLSPAGHQPMRSATGRYVIVYNGEIYNHGQLRARLEQQNRAPAWRGHSDTETLLAAIEAWGVDEAVTHATGMFAFALWDRQLRALTLGRDRIGEKPLYYGWQNGVFLFASELKALKRHPAFKQEVDRQTLTLLMRHNYIPAPHCIYRGMHKLMPGTLLTVTLAERAARPRAYWDARAVVAEGLARPFEGTPEAAVDALDAELRRSIAGQMIADVPLGAFLSGGIDSSTVVALMQQLSDRPVRTFSIGFEEDDFNEAGFAKEVAAHLGTHHTEWYISPQEARDVIPKLPAIYCEPFSDSSQIPTFLVSQLARQQVTVSLSGDGGDELFAGYNRYVLAQRFWARMASVPARVRGGVSEMILKVPRQTWSRVMAPAQRWLGNVVTEANAADRAIRAAEVLAAKDQTDLYKLLVSHWNEPESLVLDAHEPDTLLTDQDYGLQADNFIHEMMALDLVTYLPGDILVKVDRAAMANSLETRVPFLDHGVVELAWRLPLDYKLRDGVSKWPVRQVLNRYVPRRLVERPKMGFGVPIDSWLRGPLRDWAEDLIDESRLRAEGYFDPRAVHRKWAEHQSGHRNWHYHLWDVLMFQAWLAAQTDLCVETTPQTITSNL